MELTGEILALSSALVPFAEENFLLTLTNRGIYNRALKDYEALEKKEIIPGEGGLAVDLGEARVELADPLVRSRCSCPSRTVCKHVLMALFALRDAVREAPPADGTDPAGAGSGEERAAPAGEDAEDFSELLHVDLEALKKKAGKKNYEEALRETLDGFGAEFPPGDDPALLAEIPAYGLRVYFPRKESIAGAVCKCGERGLCKHKLIAVFSFLKERGLLEALPDGELQWEAELVENALSAVRVLLEKGFISADSTDIERAGQFSLKFESAGIGNLSRLFRSLAADMENMLSKSADFNPVKTFSALSRIHTTLSLLLAHRGEPEKCSPLIEKGRSLYRGVPFGTFTGLGAYPWITRSGYTGVSCLVFHREKKAILSFSSALPDFYDSTKKSSSLENLKSCYRKKEHWNPPLSLDEISRSVFTLRNCKISEGGRLSSSAETRFMPQGKTSSGMLAETAPLFPPFPPEGREGYNYFAGRDGDAYCLLSVREIAAAGYDRVRQELRFVFILNNGDDSDDEPPEVPGFIPYAEINLPAIRFIEVLAGKTLGPDWFVCRKTKESCVPLAMIDGGGVNNFYFSA